MRACQRRRLAGLPLLLLCCAVLAAGPAGARQLAAGCGVEGAACGASLRDACHSSGPGYCAPGLFCGWKFSDSSRDTACMRVPANAGRVGASCAPGNAKAPVPPSAKASTPLPTCDAGAVCIFTPTPGGSGWDAPPFASPAGALLGTCVAVDKACGSAAGKACCPSAYHQRFNPPLQLPDLCAGDLFCLFNATAASGGTPQGVCVANKPGCGKIGASCCIHTSGAAGSTTCGAAWGQAGAKGFCQYPQGGRPTPDPRDQVCTACPAAAVVAKEPSRYFGC